MDKKQIWRAAWKVTFVAILTVLILLPALYLVFWFDWRYGVAWASCMIAAALFGGLLVKNSWTG